MSELIDETEMRQVNFVEEKIFAGTGIRTHNLQT